MQIITTASEVGEHRAVFGFSWSVFGKIFVSTTKQNIPY